MNRCINSLPASLALALAGLLALAPAVAPADTAAQGRVRNFPAKALRGKLVVQLPPDVLLNGQAARLSPGARIHDTRNMLVMSGGLVGQALVVNYLRDNHGLVHEVWILTPEEAAVKRPDPVAK